MAQWWCWLLVTVIVLPFLSCFLYRALTDAEYAADYREWNERQLSSMTPASRRQAMFFTGVLGIGVAIAYAIFFYQANVGENLRNLQHAGSAILMTLLGQPNGLGVAALLLLVGGTLLQVRHVNNFWKRSRDRQIRKAPAVEFGDPDTWPFAAPAISLPFLAVYVLFDYQNAIWQNQLAWLHYIFLVLIWAIGIFITFSIAVHLPWVTNALNAIAAAAVFDRTGLIDPFVLFRGMVDAITSLGIGLPMWSAVCIAIVSVVSATIRLAGR